MNYEKNENMNEELYIKESIKNINKYLYFNDYKSAFFLMIIVLERLDVNKKNDFVNYYSKNLTKFMQSAYYSQIQENGFQEQSFEV